MTGSSGQGSTVLVATAAAVLVAGLAPACSGGPTVDTRKLELIDQVAVVSIGIPRGLALNRPGGSREAEGLGEALEMMEESARRSFERGVVDAESAAEDMRHYLFGPFADIAPFGLLSENEVLPSAGYQRLDMTSGALAAAASGMADANYVSPSSYRFFRSRYLKRGESWKELWLLLPSGTDAVLFLEAETSLDVQEVAHGVPRPSLSDTISDRQRQQMGEEEVREYLARRNRQANSIQEGDTLTAVVTAELSLEVVDRRKSTLLAMESEGESRDSLRFVFGEGYSLERGEELLGQATGAALDRLGASLRDQLRRGSASNP